MSKKITWLIYNQRVCNYQQKGLYRFFVELNYLLSRWRLNSKEKNVLIPILLSGGLVKKNSLKIYVILTYKVLATMHPTDIFTIGSFNLLLIIVVDFQPTLNAYCPVVTIIIIRRGRPIRVRCRVLIPYLPDRVPGNRRRQTFVDDVFGRSTSAPSPLCSGSAVVISINAYADNNLPTYKSLSPNLHVSVRQCIVIKITITVIITSCRRRRCIRGVY